MAATRPSVLPPPPPPFPPLLTTSFTSSTANPTTTSPGCLGVPGLLNPSDWHVIADRTLTDLHRVLAELKAAPPSPSVIRRLDDLSDLLCRVLDAAKACQSHHDQPRWREAAAAATARLSPFLVDVNADRALHTHIQRTLRLVDELEQEPTERQPQPGEKDQVLRYQGQQDLPRQHTNEKEESKESLSSRFSRETVRVGRALLRDFEVHGVLLEGESRDRFRALELARGQIIQAFVHHTQHHATPATTASDWVDDLSGPQDTITRAHTEGTSATRYSYPRLPRSPHWP